MALKKILFQVEVQYDDSEGGVICAESMKDNLFNALENERMDGNLTPSDISADWIEVKLTDKI